MKKRIALVVALLAFVIGVFDLWPSPSKRQIQQVLAEASKIELVGLDPELQRQESSELFGLRKPLKRRSLSGVETDQLRSSLNWDFRFQQWIIARCFNPRHGLALTTPKGEYRLLLCYECNQMELFAPDGKHGRLVPLNGTSQETLNSLLNR